MRIIIRVPEGGIGTRYKPMTDWLDENRGIRGWSITPAGTRGIVIDAVAIYMNGPTCAVGFVARWCVPDDPPGFYDCRPDEPVRWVSAPPHLDSRSPRDLIKSFPRKMCIAASFHGFARCQSFDLWQDTRRIHIPRLVQPTTFDELSAANQQRAVGTEEQIVHSEWRIAKAAGCSPGLNANGPTRLFDVEFQPVIQRPGVEAGRCRWRVVSRR